MRMLPHRLDATALVGVLAQIGLTLPDAARDLATREISLSTAGVAFTVEEIDAAFAKAEVSLHDRFMLKVALAQQGLIRRGSHV
jgi:hypothetical protein